MSGPTPNRPRCGPPLGLVGMLALVAVVELTVGARHLDFTTVWADDWRRTAEAATRQAKSRDVLCFGDSLVKFGVLPKVIEADAGLRSYNLAISAGTMPSAYFLLRRTLESGGRPKAVVADFFALMLADKPQVSARMYPELATVRDCLDLGWSSRDPGFLASVLLGKLLPSYKDRFEIRASILAAFQGQRASPWPAQSVIWATWKAQDGAQPMPVIPYRFTPSPAMVAALAPAGWTCDLLNAWYLERFLALAESRQIPVFWLMPPLCPEIHALRERNGSDEAYGTFAEEVQARHPGVVVLDARFSGYGGEVHIDEIHLDHRGAEALSRDVAAVVAGRLRGGEPAGRWVALPPLAPRPGDAAGGGLAGSRVPAIR